jgi:hypothetical protein
MKAHTFTSAVLDDEVWPRDIDQSAGSRLIDQIASVTGVPTEHVRSLTLRRYEGIAYERLYRATGTPWVRSLGIYHRRRVMRGQQACVQCVKHGGHLKLIWRLSLSFMCLTHGVELIDACEGCGHPLEFHRRDMGDFRALGQPLSVLCTHCGVPLRRGRVVYSHALRRSQASLDAILGGGDAHIGKRRVQPLVYMNGLRLLIAACTNGRHGLEFRSSLARVLRRPGLLNVERRKGRRYFEEYSCLERGEILAAATRLTEEWPHAFVEAAQDAGLRASAWSGYGLLPPYWLDRVIRSNLCRSA